MTYIDICNIWIYINKYKHNTLHFTGAGLWFRATCLENQNINRLPLVNSKVLVFKIFFYFF